MEPRIDIPHADPRERALARTIGIPDLLARVLLARGFDDIDRVRRHLKPDLRDLSDPFTFRQMERAAERIRRALANGERIMVHGDYDVDGVSGTVLLLKLFELVQADVKPFIPRREDGYSFTQASLDAVREGGFRLLISVDNGTNAIDYVDRIQAAGCDVIVTDHHGTVENTARPYALINPRLPEAGYPDRELAGCGVAFRLATALCTSLSPSRTLSDEFRAFLVEAVAYVALGTVADVAPLRGENRILVHHGLRALAANPNPGIRALLDCAGLASRCPEVEDIAFRIAPLINAAGRMGHAMDAVNLLMAPGYQEAQEASRVLECHNERRRAAERNLMAIALEQAQAMPEPILVLAGQDWHQGVLGIVAARLAETIGKPTLLLTIGGDGRARGSGRSAGSLDLRQALVDCSEVLTSHGGHRAAVGLELPAAHVDELRKRINARSGDAVQPMAGHPPDGPIEFREIEPRVLRQLDQLGPFGVGNPRPTFACGNVRLVGRPHVDARGADLRLRLVQDGHVFPARLLGGARRMDELRACRSPLRLVFAPKLSRWGEEGGIELLVSHLENGV